jgi:hypothetical protein
MSNSTHSETKPTPSAPITGAIDPINGTLSPPKTGHFIDKPYKAVNDSRLMMHNTGIDAKPVVTHSENLAIRTRTREGLVDASRTREHTIPSEQFCPTTGEPYSLEQAQAIRRSMRR